MLNCIIATILPKSGTNRPRTPASFIRRSTASRWWRAGQPPLVGGIDAVVVDDEIGRAGDLVATAARRQTEKPVEHRRRLAVVLFQRRAEDAGQVADVLGDK